MFTPIIWFLVFKNFELKYASPLVFAVGVELAHFLDDLSLAIMEVDGMLEKSVLLTALGVIINSVAFVKQFFFRKNAFTVQSL